MAEQKPWSVLAYIVARSDGGLHTLDQSVRREIKTLCSAADLARLEVAVQVDFTRIPGTFRATLKQDVLMGFGPANPERYDLWRSILHNLKTADLHLERERRRLNAATDGVLHDFLTFGRRECRASRHVIFFYGHAFGPMGLFFDTTSGSDGPKPLRLHELSRALRSKQPPAAVILFRDCFVDTLEMAYQLHGVARYMIACQAGVPIAANWPWLPMISVLMTRAHTPEIAAALVLQLAWHFQNKANRGRVADVPMALIDIEAAQKMKAPLRALVRELEKARGTASRRKACAAAIDHARFGRPDNVHRPGDPALVDIPAMCENLQALAPDPVAPVAARLATAVDRVIVAHYSLKERFRGLSIFYKPRNRRDVERSFVMSSGEDEIRADEASYRKLALNQATGWDRVALRPL
jgi:hypothetical protein